MFWWKKKKPEPLPINEPTISSNALDYESDLLWEFQCRMARVFNWTNKVEKPEVKKAFIEICEEMAKELREENEPERNYHRRG